MKTKLPMNDMARLTDAVAFAAGSHGLLDIFGRAYAADDAR